MRKHLPRALALLLCAALLLTLFPAALAAEKDSCQAILDKMTTREKVAQMLVPAFRYWPDASGASKGMTTLPKEVAESIASYGFGGAILFGQNTAENAATVRLVDAMQQANAQKAGRPQLLIAVDQEGGSITRLDQGTQMTGNMALGAANRLSVTRSAARLIGQEVSALGINVNFAPVVDVNSDPANPVIGLRSFSDDPEVVSAHGAAFVQEQNATGVISTLKHFPGHGDTDTDSHTGLPSVNKTYEELKASDLMPFQACIDAGAEMIMTAHIQYPQVEKTTVTSASTGRKVYLPATLSKTILTDVLRGDMGFTGVIITDSMVMDAITEHFGALEAARLAIAAGADMLLMPVEVRDRSDLSALGRYVTNLAAMVDKGTIPMKQVDAAVLRILQLKERHGLLNTYKSGNLEARVKTAVETVGSRTNHETEWDIAKRAVTLIKNENNTLPIRTETGKTVIFTAYDTELMAANYAVQRLITEGEIPEDADISVYSYQYISARDVESRIRGAAHVIVVSELYRQANLVPGENAACSKVDAAIAAAHAGGADVSVLSASLPYDVGRYPAADAFMLCWGARGMYADPTGKETGISQYGTDLPAGLYMMLCKSQTPQGVLPVDIPALDENYQYKDQVIYAKGWGLRYKGVYCDRGADCPLNDYKDTDKNAWYHNGVHYALEKGLLTGYGDGVFGTQDNANRAMVVTMLYRMAGKPAVSGTLSFADVPADSYYADPVRWATSEGIVYGYDETTFGPFDDVTREQLSSIFYRYAEYLKLDRSADDSNAILPYKDLEEISPWAMKSMSWACGTGLMKGVTEDTLAPRKGTTRAELATVLLRWDMMDKYLESDGQLLEGDEPVAWESPYAYSPIISADAEEVYAYLRYLGLSEAVCCGILANMECESNFVLTALGDGGTSFGLCQWHNNRWRLLETFCETNGFDPCSVQGQIEYLYWELNNVETQTWNALQTVSNDPDGAAAASEIWLRTYERPLDPASRVNFQAWCAREKYWDWFVVGGWDGSIYVPEEPQEEAGEEAAPEEIPEVPAEEIPEETAEEPAPEAAPQPEAAPAAESVTEAATEPAAEATAEPTAEPTADAATEGSLLTEDDQMVETP